MLPPASSRIVPRSRPLLSTLVLCLLLSLSLCPRSSADSPLARLTCLRLSVVAFSAESFGVLEEDVKAFLVEWLRTTLPALAIRDTCPDIFRLSLHMVGLPKPSSAAYSGILKADLRRPSSLLATGDIVTTPVWASEIFLFYGDNGATRDQVARMVPHLLQSFLQEYRKAGNE